MAEHAESRYQKLTPIWELIKSSNLMPDKDFTKWRVKMKNFEYKLTQPSRKLELFVDYCLAVRELYQIIGNDKSKDTEPQRKVIQEELKNLLLSKFGTSIRDFKHDMKYWEFRINLLNELGLKDKVILTYHECVKVHGPSIPQVYIEFSNYTYNSDVNKDSGFKSAIGILMKGIRFHPTFPGLYVQGIQLALEYEQYKLDMATTSKKSKKPSYDCDLRMAKKLYDEGYKKLETQPQSKNQQKLLNSFNLQCFTILEKYEFASDSELIRKIMDKV